MNQTEQTSLLNVTRLMWFHLMLNECEHLHQVHRTRFLSMHGFLVLIPIAFDFVSKKSYQIIFCVAQRRKNVHSSKITWHGVGESERIMRELWNLPTSSAWSSFTYCQYRRFQYQTFRVKMKHRNGFGQLLFNQESKFQWDWMRSNQSSIFFGRNDFALVESASGGYHSIVEHTLQYAGWCKATRKERLITGR